MKSETEFRVAIVAEAKSWIGTPYRLCGRVKGAGVNCAEFLYGVAENAEVLPRGAQPPRWYTPQLATHSKEERLIEYIKAYGAREIREDDVQPGDIVVYKTGKAHGHAAICLGWPEIIHVLPAFGCQQGRVDDGVLAAFSRRYFTLWKG